MRRRLLIIVIFLLAGAVVNVAVAWGIALSVNPYDRPLVIQFDAEMSGGTVLRFSRISAFGTVSYSCPGRDWEPRRGRVLPAVDDALPRWVSRHEIYTATGNWINGSGWPLLVFSTSIHPKPGAYAKGYDLFGGIETPLEPFTYGGIKLPKGFTLPPGVKFPGGSTMPRVFPLRPIWTGMLVNTLLYAVVLTSLWLAGHVFVFRYLTRARRGLCPKCGYPMGESAVCSECGRALPTRTVTHRSTP